MDEQTERSVDAQTERSMDDRNEQRILVIGGAGFIGSCTVQRLIEDASETSKLPNQLPTKLWVLDNLHPQVHGEPAEPPIFAPEVTFVQGDVGDRTLLTQLLMTARPTVIIHMAAETGTGQSINEIYRYCQVNVMGTAVLLEAIAQAIKTAQLPLKRFILMSSRAVYGEGAYWDTIHRQTVVPPPRRTEDLKAGRFNPVVPGSTLQPAPTSESTPPVPSSIYASTKLMQEHLVQQAGAIAPWNATIFRFQNVYGPGQSLKNPYTGVLSIFSGQILAGQTLNIYEDGQIGRDFVFIDDVVNALVLACHTEVPHGSIINIGSGKTTTILEAAKILLRLYNKPTDAYRITGNFRIGDIRHAVADIQLAQQLLGWEPKVSIEDGFSKLADWCRAEHSVDPS